MPSQESLKADPQQPLPIVKSFVVSFAKGAGLPENALDQLDDVQLAEQAGQLLRQTCSQLMLLLQARAEAKTISRSGGRTMVKATENNPLKFLPTPEEAVQAMLSQRGKSYLDAQETLESSFADLKQHHFALLAAIQFEGCVWVCYLARFVRVEYAF